MAEKAFELDDPYALVGMAFPASDAEQLDREMTRAIVEEYALLGMPRAKVWRLFASPFFAGTHAILARRGEEFVREILDEVFGPAPQEVQ